MRDKAVLPNVERMLASAAKKQAKAKRARRNSRGFMIIAIAGLALTGSALAATGVWNPLGGDQHRAPDPAPPGKSVGVRAGVAPSIQAPPGKSQGRRPTPDASGSGLATTASQVAAPVVDQGGAPVVGQGPGQDDAGPQGPLSIDDGKSTSGGSDDGPQADPPGQQGDNPKGPPSDPLPTQISASCGFLLEENPPRAQCRATVSGAAGAPTGRVSLETSSSGQFSPAACDLSDDGNGTTSSCSFDWIPNGLSRGEGVAHYGGDTTNAPSSGSFVLPGF